ncbi:hypothetical protein HMI55_001129, partial [Coelomomyces lativittatus]
QVVFAGSVGSRLEEIFIKCEPAVETSIARPRDEIQVWQIFAECKKGDGIQYLVEWANDSELSWESKTNLADVVALDEWELQNSESAFAAVSVLETVEEACWGALLGAVDNSSD